MIFLANEWQLRITSVNNDLIARKRKGKMAYSRHGATLIGFYASGGTSLDIRRITRGIKVRSRKSQYYSAQCVSAYHFFMRYRYTFFVTFQ